MKLSSDHPFPAGSPAAKILAAIRAALGPGARPPLGAGRAAKGPWRSDLDSLPDEELLGAAVNRRESAAAVRAGLLLFAGDLDASHTLSQGIHTTDGSFWHGIMHRREGDFSNAGYWFRRVGEHPVYESIATFAAGMANHPKGLAAKGPWDPYQFIKLVEACESGSDPASRTFLEELQECEMLTLLAHCHRRAIEA